MKSSQSFITAVTVLVVLTLPKLVYSTNTNSCNYIIYVTGKTEGCKGKGNVSYCGNLDDVFSVTIENSTAIQFTTNFTRLSIVILFKGLTDIAIIGAAMSTTTVECA